MCARKLRAGVIGCGFFAPNQLHAWKEIEGVDLAAVCDQDLGRAKAMQRAFGVRQAYDDATAMLRQEDLDFVDIITNVSSHRPLVELAAASNCHVICQKPLTTTLEDAAAMMDACKRAGVHLMVHENFRWQAPMRQVRALLDQGIIGQAFFGRISFRTHHNPFEGQPWLAQEERFILLDLGIHLLDLARYLFGEPEGLSASTGRSRKDIRGEDSATILLTYPWGGVVVDCSYASYAETDLFPQTLVSVEGSEGSVHLLPGFRLQIVTPAGVESRTVEVNRWSWASERGLIVQDSVVRIQQHWVDCLRADREPETNAADNMRTLALTLGAYQAAAENIIFKSDWR